MRVAVIVVSMSILVVATPLQASDSCMNKTEARQHFGSVHIYWHGAGHCWDATPVRHRQITHRIQHRTREPLLAKNDQPKDDQLKTSQPKWRDSMSELLADSEPDQALRARTSGNGNHDSAAAAGGSNWSDRWVDIDQVAPPRIIASGPEPVVASPIMASQSDPKVTPREVAFVCIVIVLTLLAMEVLIRRRGFA